jgi:KTSC domain
VRSSAIASVGYREATETLEVEFRSGAVYAYHHVPPAVYQALLGASSKGRYISRHVRDRFPYTRRDS